MMIDGSFYRHNIFHRNELILFWLLLGGGGGKLVDGAAVYGGNDE